MATEQQVAERSLLPGERLVLVQRGGVMVGAVANGEMLPIGEFGQSKGWLAVTSQQRVLYGYLGGLGSAKLEGAFAFTIWREDPRGLAFLNEGFGPEDLCIFVPRAVHPAVLHGAMTKVFGNQSRVRELQELYANRVSFGAAMLSEYADINRIYGALRDLGADADPVLVDQEKAENVECMAANPGLQYYEPHLNRERFDSERPDRQ